MEEGKDAGESNKERKEEREDKEERKERKEDGMMLKCPRKRREEERQRLEKIGEEWVRETGVTDC